MNRRKGFTLIELILVIAILGILAVSALPRFLNLSVNARQAARDGVVGAVRSGIALWRANQMVGGNAAAGYPAALETAQADGDCTNCFGDVLATGVNDDAWQKTGATTYTYNDGNTTPTFTYNITNGTFTTP